VLDSAAAPARRRCRADRRKREPTGGRQRQLPQGGKLGQCPVRGGSRASANIPASAGAFARLRAPLPPPRGRIDITRVVRSAASQRSTTDHPSAFGPGGVVVRRGTSSFDADVGQSVSIHETVQLDE
jgi:hypothetical protein